jgi:hypothetical protein
MKGQLVATVKRIGRKQHYVEITVMLIRKKWKRKKEKKKKK